MPLVDCYESVHMQIVLMRVSACMLADPVEQPLTTTVNHHHSGVTSH